MFEAAGYKYTKTNYLDLLVSKISITELYIRQYNQM